MLGFIISNIVGIQYYADTISGREMVGLVREPLNPHDSNAIKVLNTQTIQVGHIERSVAAVLSPLIDAHTILVEGIVPNSRASGNRFKIPCQIHVFSRIEAFEEVKSTISGVGLHLIKFSDFLKHFENSLSSFFEQSNRAPIQREGEITLQTPLTR
jgi:SWI/SNF-related matrix-associated actin-dependent regulator of chromatin subfamily A3